MRKFFTSIIILFAPVVTFIIVLAPVKLLLLPSYLSIAYKMPNIPEDKYNFSIDDRLFLSKISVDFLTSDMETEYLQQLRFIDSHKKVFTNNEIDHLLDVKNVIRNLFSWWWLAIALLLTTGALCFTKNQTELLRDILWYGAWLTIVFFAAIEVASLMSFGDFFAKFHSIFFVGDSWIFPENSTLIRLFPIEFWKNALNTIGLIALTFCLLIIILGYRPNHTNNSQLPISMTNLPTNENDQNNLKTMTTPDKRKKAKTKKNSNPDKKKKTKVKRKTAK